MRRTESVQQLSSLQLQLVWVDLVLAEQAQEVVFCIYKDTLAQLVYVLIVQGLANGTVCLEVSQDINQRPRLY